MTPFYPAKSCLWVTLPYFPYNALDLACRCRLKLDEASLEKLKKIPRGAGLIVVSNHTDEMDIRVLIEFARRAGKRFRFMVNQEAFEEMRGFAGFWLARIGCFSVERGASDPQAREFALQTVQSGRESLVMFPEGEIFYLNDQVQTFKTGAVFLGFEALQAMLAKNPHSEVYILPVGLKYRYEEPVTQVLKHRLEELEQKIQIKPKTEKVQERLNQLILHVIEKYRMESTARSFASYWAKLAEDIHLWRMNALANLEKKYTQIWEKPSQQLMDRANRLMADIRRRIAAEPKPEGAALKELRKDLEILKRTVWFAGWSPQYHMEKPSEERLAESVIKLEREILGVKRPAAMGPRSVFIRAGEPIALARFLSDYAQDSKDVCRKITDHLQAAIQSLVEQKPAPGPDPNIFHEIKHSLLNICVDTEDGQKVCLDHYKNGHTKGVVIAPGFFNSKSAVLLKELAGVLSKDYDVAVMDFRGHGESPGFFYWTAKEYLDLEAVIRYMKREYSEVGVIGFSMGAATSIITASRSRDVKTIVAVSPPTEFEKIEYRFWELDPDHDIFYNLVGEGRYGKGVRPGPFWLKKDKPIHCIKQVQASILFLHGTKDWLIKPAHSVQLHEAAQTKKRLEMIEGGPHAEYLLLKNREPMLKHIQDWLRETL